MPRGGKRIGAGGKFKWNHGKTTVVRIPESIAEKVLDYARYIDSLPFSVTQSSQSCYDAVTGSKVIDLSGLVIRSHMNQPAVLLSDLINAGYRITPDRLMQSPTLRSALNKQDRVKTIKTELKENFSNMNLVYE
jgi:hypothetical protein